MPANSIPRCVAADLRQLGFPRVRQLEFAAHAALLAAVSRLRSCWHEAWSTLELEMEAHMPIGRWAEIAPAPPGWQAAAIVQVWKRPADCLPNYVMQAVEQQVQNAEEMDMVRPASIYAPIAGAFTRVEAIMTMRASRRSRLDVGGTAVTGLQMGEVLQATHGTAPAHTIEALHTLLGGWSTAFRMQRGRHSCSFGFLAPSGVGAQQHLLACSVLWAAVCEAATRPPPQTCAATAALTLRHPGEVDHRRRRRRKPPMQLLRLRRVADVYHRAAGRAMAESRVATSRARLNALNRGAMLRLGKLRLGKLRVDRSPISGMCAFLCCGACVCGLELDALPHMGKHSGGRLMPRRRCGRGAVLWRGGVDRLLFRRVRGCRCNCTMWRATGEMHS